MQAIVMEIKDSKCAVMLNDGTFKQIKNKNYTIGQQITLTSIKTKLVTLYTSIVASISAFVVAIGMYFMPYGTVCLDVNPSIEYTINRFDIVLSATAFNDDGSEILEEIKNGDIKNKKIEDAINNTINTLQNSGYLQTEDTNYVMLSSNTKDEKHTENLAENLGQHISEQKKDLRIMSEVNTKEDIEKAKEFGISPGKMKLINQISPDVDVDEYKDKPVADIMKEIDKEQPSKEQPIQEQVEPKQAETFNKIEQPPQLGKNDIEESTREKPERQLPKDNATPPRETQKLDKQNFL